MKSAYAATGSAFVVLAALLVPATSAVAATTSPNLIRNPGAESTGSAPTPSGSKVPLKMWTVAKKSNATAVAYGADGFPTPTSPGPKKRGKNFFAGGSDGAMNSASQVDSLKAYQSWIRHGHARFELAGWLGGYSSQGDNCVLSVTWLGSNGKKLGSASVGPVTPAERKNVTGLLHRATHGIVPSKAATVRVTLTMRRVEGTYDDGYADNLFLQVRKG